MFGSLPSIFSITSRLPSFSLQEVINLLTFGAFFVWHKRTKACFANGSIFTTDKSSLFPDLKLEILPKFKRDKIRTGKSEGCQKFSVFLSQMFSTKNIVETWRNIFFLFILFLFEILNFNYQQFHEFFKRNFRAESRLKLFSFLSSFKIQKSLLRLSQNVNKLINSAYSAQLAGDDKAARLSGLSNAQGRRKVWKSRGVDCDVVGVIFPYWFE